MDVLQKRKENGSKFREASAYSNCIVSEMNSHLVLPAKYDCDYWDFECLLCDDFVADCHNGWVLHAIRKHESFHCSICNKKFFWQADVNQCNHRPSRIDGSVPKHFYGNASDTEDDDDEDEEMEEDPIANNESLARDTNEQVEPDSTTDWLELKY